MQTKVIFFHTIDHFLKSKDLDHSTFVQIIEAVIDIYYMAQLYLSNHETAKINIFISDNPENKTRRRPLACINFNSQLAS